jgi:1-acyl-sn-glycerol-3-phosphate acyltransferase
MGTDGLTAHRPRAGASTDGATSDWWPSAFGAGRWRVLRRALMRARIVGPAATPRARFGPGYALARMILTPLYRVLWSVHVEGGEHLPRRGPAILAANHVSFFDSVVLIMSARRTLSFVGKAEYLDSWKTRRLLPALGMIPVDRSDGRRALVALKIAARLLRAGKLFAIYPEGTRSLDGDLHAGHTGAAYLSMATGASIVPTGIVGTARIQPPGTRVPRPFRPVTVRFGAPIDPTTYSGSRRHRRRLITDDVMTAIQSLSGQDHSEPAADSSYSTVIGRRSASDRPAARPSTSGARPSAPDTGGGPPVTTASTNASHWSA